MASIRGRLFKGAAWISGARMIVNLLGFASTLVLARLLTPADFGLVALGMTFLTILNSITEVSVSSALIQHADPSEEHFHTAWTVGLLRASGVAAVLALLAWPAAWVFGEPRLVLIMLALAVTVLIGGFSNPIRVMLTKQLVFWQQFVLEVAQKSAALAASVAVAVLFRSYWALIAGALASELTGLILSYMVAPFRPRAMLVHWRELFSFSIWLTYAQLINTINWRFDQLLIGGFAGKTALGYYTVGDNLASMPSREAIAPLTSTLFPAFSNIPADDAPRLRAAYQKAQGVVTAVALPVGVGVALVAEPLVRLAMGDKWLPAVLVIQVLSSVFALQTLGSLAQPLAMARGETKMLFRRDTQAFVMRVPLIVLGMVLGGMRGVVFARLFSGSISIVFNLKIVRQLTGLSYGEQLGSNARALASVAVMAAAVLLAHDAMPVPQTRAQLVAALLAQAAIGAAVYLTATLAFWFAARRPAGPETEMMTLGQRLIGRLLRLRGGGDAVASRS